MACKGNSAVYVKDMLSRVKESTPYTVPGMVTTNSSVLKLEM